MMFEKDVFQVGNVIGRKQALRFRGAGMALVIITVLFLSGCWDYNDYNNLALVSALGIDFNETSKEITVTVQYYIPEVQGGIQQGGAASKLPISGAVKGKGYTITNALSTIQEARRKRLFYAYMDVLVIGETAAENIMDQVVQLIDRTPNDRTSTYLALTKGRAEDILTTMDPNTAVTIGRNIHDLIDVSNKSGCSYPVTVEDFAEKLAISGIEPVAPQVSVKIVKAESESSGSSDSTNSDNSSGSGSSAVSSSGDSSVSESSGDEQPVKLDKLNEGYQFINGTAAFLGGKLIGWLDQKESTGLGYINNKKMTPYETVHTTSEKDIKTAIMFLVTKSQSKIKVSIENGSPVFTVDTYIEANLLKFNENTDFSFLTPEAVTYMEKQMALNVKAELEASIEKGQKELKTDIFGFGFELYRFDPGLWKAKYQNNWDTLFPKMPVKIIVRAKVVNTGTNIKTFDLK